MLGLAVDNVVDWLDGKSPRCTVNADVLPQETSLPQRG
jgi:hypothetical protein